MREADERHDMATAWISAVVFPVAGLVWGIYLLARSDVRGGAVLAVSVIVAAAWIAILG